MPDPKYDLSFRTRKSVAYHDHRRSYYKTLDAAVKVLGLVLASAVFADNFGHDDWAKGLALLFVVASSASIVHRFGAMANLHDLLYKDFIQLQQELVIMQAPSKEDLDALQSKVLAVESREPPIYSALNRYCHNQICRIDEEYDYIQPLRWYHILLKNVRPFHDLPAKHITAGG